MVFILNAQKTFKYEITNTMCQLQSFTVSVMTGKSCHPMEFVQGCEILPWGGDWIIISPLGRGIMERSLCNKSDPIIN